MPSKRVRPWSKPFAVSVFCTSESAASDPHLPKTGIGMFSEIAVQIQLDLVSHFDQKYDQNGKYPKIETEVPKLLSKRTDSPGFWPRLGARDGQGSAGTRCMPSGA